MSGAEDALGDGHITLAHGDERIAGDALLGRRGAAFHVPCPPRVEGGAAIERAAAGDRDIFLFKRVDERRVVHAFDAFPAREHDRVKRGVGVETQRGAGGDV